MKKLTLLSSKPSYIDRYKDIRDSKHEPTKTSLVGIHADISSQYTKYENAIAANNLETLSSCANCATVTDQLRSCYDSPTNALRKLKKEIKSSQPKRQLKYCPMCGTTIPSTFDHYLPASKFPEYSVFGPNLVPCCALCNSTKDADWLKAGSRQYFYAYIDDIPDQNFLEVRLCYDQELDGVGAVFNLTRPNGLGNLEWNLLRSHYVKLGLIDRFNELGNDEVAEIISDSQIYIEEKGKNVRKFLKNRAKRLRDVHGRNYWRAVLMTALAEHPNFENWVSQA